MIKENLDITYFRLKDAISWNQMGQSGRIVYKFIKENPVTVSLPQDIRMFRGKPEMFSECTFKGERVSYSDRGERLENMPLGATPLSKRIFNKMNASSPAQYAKNTISVSTEETEDTETISVETSEHNPLLAEGVESLEVSVKAEDSEPEAEAVENPNPNRRNKRRNK